MTKTYLAIIAVLSIYAVVSTPFAFRQARSDIIEWSIHQPEADMAIVKMQNDSFEDLPMDGVK